MPNETEKPLTPAQVAAQKLQEQQAQNLADSKRYQTLVGKTFSNGKQSAKITQYVPTRLTKDGPRQQFLVNFGNPHVSFFRNCKEFCEQFTSETNEQPAAQPATTDLPQ
jgi:hypothetical protein